ncbi:MAG: hypothetical protein H0T79_03460 [Deltaproteobacteria bacterium]|nr:hypothetical protein [Deltaproteobacteria bacterium]
MPAHMHVHNSGLARERAYEVQKFLNGLAKALTAGDGKQIAAMWEVPAMIIGAEDVRVFTSLIEVEVFMGSAKEHYNARGIMNTRAHVLALDWVGDRVVVVKVRWPHLDAKGKEIGGEASDYTLRRNAAGELKVRAILMRGTEPSHTYRHAHS